MGSHIYGAGHQFYRGFHIYFDPPPIPTRANDWHFVHDDYDGAEDANDNRHGHAASVEECKAEIDDWHEEQGE